MIIIIVDSTSCEKAGGKLLIQYENSQTNPWEGLKRNIYSWCSIRLNTNGDIKLIAHSPFDDHMLFIDERVVVVPDRREELLLVAHATNLYK